jgi:hypothetical protein
LPVLGRIRTDPDGIHFFHHSTNRANNPLLFSEHSRIPVCRTQQKTEPHPLFFIQRGHNPVFIPNTNFLSAFSRHFPASRMDKTAFCTCRRFSASSKISCA